MNLDAVEDFDGYVDPLFRPFRTNEAGGPGFRLRSPIPLIRVRSMA